MPIGAVIPAAGFADPTHDAQRAFRAVLDALAHPTQAFGVAGPDTAPSELGPGLAAVALTIFDESCVVWLDSRRTDSVVPEWLAFHTGVRTTADPAIADFVVCEPATMPHLGDLRVGSDEAPDRSATVLIDARGTLGCRVFAAAGPGINGTRDYSANWADEDFAAQWQTNTEKFPRGVDLLIVGQADVTGLPRTTRLTDITAKGEG